MAMQLYLYYGSTTLDFQGGGYTLLDSFYPTTPTDAGNVTEKFTLSIRGSSQADLESKVRRINIVFLQARLHKAGANGVYLHFSVNSSDTAWRSRIVDGAVMQRSSLGLSVREYKATVDIAVERLPWWEGEEEQVPLNNTSGSGNIDGLTLYSCNDSNHENWFAVSGSSVVGDMPAATRLELTNNYASGRLYDVWLGQNWTDPSNMAHILEAENATGGSSVSSGSASGGYYQEIDVSTTEADALTWALTPAFLNACQGQYFKMMIKFHMAESRYVKYRLKITWNATTLWDSGQVLSDSLRAIAVRDLFTVRLPPWIAGLTDLDGVNLVLSCQAISGVITKLYIDFLQITPTDGWRYLTNIGYGVPHDNLVVDDGIESYLYQQSISGSGMIGNLIGYGAPISLYPGKMQKFYTLMHSAAINNAEIDRTVSAKLFYRPRKVTL